MVPTQEALWEPHPGQERLREQAPAGFWRKEAEYGKDCLNSVGWLWSWTQPEPGQEERLDAVLVNLGVSHS